MKVNILGTEWTINFRTQKEDNILNNADGYCDRTTREIVVLSNADLDSTLADFEVYQKKVMRHEIIHAFMYESGLGECWEHSRMGQDEQTVDWIAVQFPKILKAFTEAGCI